MSRVILNVREIWHEFNDVAIREHWLGYGSHDLFIMALTNIALNTSNLPDGFLSHPIVRKLRHEFMEQLDDVDILYHDITFIRWYLEGHCISVVFDDRER